MNQISVGLTLMMVCPWSFRFRGQLRGELKDSERGGSGRHEGEVFLKRRKNGVCQKDISKLTQMFHSCLRREILFDYEQYEFHGTSVSRRLFLFSLFCFPFGFWKLKMKMDLMICMS